jgi:hypothetical protein
MSEPPKKDDDIDDFWSSLDREDLACLGLRHTSDDDRFESELWRELRKERLEQDLANLPKPRKSDKPTKNRKPNVIQQARTAGIDVARIEMKPDGTVVIVTGKPEPAAPENPWLADLHKETKQ